MTSTSANSSSSNPTIIGISHQPYRSYLTDRNHFYHSASVANPSQSAQLSSSPQYTQQTSSSSQQQSSSPVKSTSRTSLNSNSSQHHQNTGMAKTKRSSTTSSTLPIGSDGYKHTATDEEGEDPHNGPSACSRCLFGFLWVLAQIGLFGAVILLAYWIFKFDKGFAFQNDSRKMFNLHSFLMLSGFIFVNGQSMLIYKTYLCCKKIYNKITHAIFFVLSISLVSFGMLVGIQAQHITSNPDQAAVHFYSLHSWIGLVTCGLFALQFFFGFITFLVLLCCERATSGYRARFLPVHVTFGIVIFMLACAACLSGLLQTARSRLSGPNPAEPTRANYKDIFIIRDNNPFMNSALVLNSVGACLIALAVLIPYLIRNFNFRRRNEAASFYVNH